MEEKRILCTTKLAQVTCNFVYCIHSLFFRLEKFVTSVEKTTIDIATPSRERGNHNSVLRNYRLSLLGGIMTEQ